MRIASRRRLRLPVLAVLGIALAGGAAGAQESKAPWTYDGPDGPDHWGDLEAGYAACANGAMQSPIDLAQADATGTIAFTVAYAAVPLTLWNNGRTVQIVAKDGGGLSEMGVDYRLLQVHFHAPSEHVVKGEHAPLEAHFVHQAADGTLAVRGVLFAEGAENPTLAALLEHLPETPGDPTTVAGATIDPGGLLPADRGIYRYIGSLTTPPCSEGVHWHVVAARATASKAQIERLARVLHGNARPVQPLNHRLLVAPAR